MIAHIDTLGELNFFSKLDCHFALSMANISGEDSPFVLLGAAAASCFTRQGHVCAPLGDLAGSPVTTNEGEPLVPPEDGALYWPEKEPWLTALRQSSLVGTGCGLSPLVLQNNRLYLFRYWQYEHRLAEELIHRRRSAMEVQTPGRTEELIDLLFPRSNRKIAQQREAAIHAVNHRLTIISGGPGTGKTTTVLKILAVILAQLSPLSGGAPQIMLMAPTGKAAARLSESIGMAKAEFEFFPAPLIKETLKIIPDDATTIHKALRSRFDNSTRFVHTRENPLAAHIVVVDEASMIDVALMSKLLDAVPPVSRILLLGDKNQLASVEAGSVLGDICDAWGTAETSGPDSNGVVQLQHSFRFDAQKGIGRLSDSINRGDFADTLTAFSEDKNKEIRLLDCRDENSLKEHVTRIALANYRDYLTERDPAKCLERFDRFRILCAHRRGALSVEHLNQMVETALAEEGRLDPQSAWYRGRPILVTRNDARLRLWNGDLGIVLERGENTEELAAFFGEAGGQSRMFSLSRLPHCETVFAMTVHKAQGSEYDEVLFVLPDHPSPVLTRELLYTAVTRARKRVTVIGQKRILEYAVGSKVRRTSGLKQRLGHGNGQQLSFGFL